MKRDVMVRQPMRLQMRTIEKLRDAVLLLHELATAAEQYLAFFERQAESPKVNAVRHRVQTLIARVRGE